MISDILSVSIRPIILNHPLFPYMDCGGIIEGMLKPLFVGHCHGFIPSVKLLSHPMKGSQAYQPQSIKSHMEKIKTRARVRASFVVSLK